MTSRSLAPVLDHIDAELPAAINRLKDVLRIPSISTDPAYAEACQKAAAWLAADLASFGVKAEVDQTAGHPMVRGTAGECSPHLLFYGHYDVQPVDPLALWTHDPFDPVVADGPAGPMIVARGASDDKGQLMTFVEACRAFVAVHGTLPCRVTFLFEGEEESGSPSLIPYLLAKADALRAELALICDTGMIGRRIPAITTRLRGLAKVELALRAARCDLHSGLYGGAALNPAHVLARILADLHDAEGRVTLAGFYEGVDELSPEERAAWASLPISSASFLGPVGLSEPAGERDRSLLEQIWARPTAEVNGMAAGYTGPGFKTVLPAEARAKVSFRLVGKQDPQAVLEAFRAYVLARLPKDCQAEFLDQEGSPAVTMDTRHPAFAVAQRALSEEWREPAVFIGSGGSIPIAGYFQTLLGMDSLLVGFARDDDRVHSPNEKYDLDAFHKGIRSWARILYALATRSD